MRLLSLIAVMTSLSCSEKEFTKDPAESFKIARDPYDSKDYEIAATKLAEYKSRFPYSQYAVEAELLLANCQFELQQFEESANTYSQFVKLHPKHPELPFAMFRVGESYWNLAPDDIDREQEFTIRAVDEWKKLIEKVPSSSYAKKAKDLVREGKMRIARSFEFVAAFYCKQAIYSACAFRYINLARSYPEFKEMRKNALEKAADALEIVSEQKKEDPKSDKNIYFNTLDAKQIKELAQKLRREAKGSRSSPREKG